MEKVDNNSEGGKQERNESEIKELSKSPRQRWDRKVEFLFACIGFAVGYGNFWRFPYLCFKNGGGAFLIPYVLFLFLGGVPLFFLELSLGQLCQEGPIKAWKKICPLLSGIGFAMVTISFLVSIYYNVILAWSIYFLYNSFLIDIPWVGCHHPWNTQKCYQWNASRPNMTGVSSSREFLVHNALEITSSIEKPGSLNVKLTVCLLVAWVLVYFCIWRGIRTTGKVVYVTATLPYFILLILLVKGVTLPGAANGILYYVTPQWHKLKDPAVWIDAASQILYSLTVGFGVILAFASYNKRNNNIYKDALTISIINCFTSALAGFVIFTFVGYMAHVQKRTVPEVASQGPGLVFIVYPAALAQLPAPHVWAVIFFLMLIALGLDSQFGQVEVVAAAIVEQYDKRLRRYRELVVLAVCVVMFLLGLSCITQGGMYVFNLFDSFSCGLSLLLLVLLELIVIGWIYDARRFANDIEDMTGHPVSFWWVACWKFISPLIVCAIFIMNLVKHKPITYEGQSYPKWARALGWFITLISIAWVPCVAFFKIMTSSGSLLRQLSSDSTGKVKGCDGSNPTTNCPLVSKTGILDAEETDL